MSPALADGFSSTVPPGKSQNGLHFVGLHFVSLFHSLLLVNFLLSGNHQVFPLCPFWEVHPRASSPILLVESIKSTWNQVEPDSFFLRGMTTHAVRSWTVLLWRDVFINLINFFNFISLMAPSEGPSFMRWLLPHGPQSDLSDHTHSFLVSNDIYTHLRILPMDIL